MIVVLSLLLSKKEKEKIVIKLAEEGKTTREIAKLAHLSLREIGAIIRRATGDLDLEVEKKANTEEQQRIEKLKKASPYAKAFHMFREGRPLSQVVVELDLKADVVLDYYNDYLKLLDMKRLVMIHNEIGDGITLFIYLYRRVVNEGLSKQQVCYLIKTQGKLLELEKKVPLFNDHIGDLKSEILFLEQKKRDLES